MKTGKMKEKKRAKTGQDHGIVAIRWTPAQARAAAMVAEGRASDAEIYGELRVSSRVLTRWKAHPDFAARVDQLRRQAQNRIERFAIARQEARLKRQNERWELLGNGLQRIVTERAIEMAEVPGGASGLLARDFKGKDADRAVYRVDGGLVDIARELRELEKNAAQELGQWKTGEDDGASDAYTLEEYVVLARRATVRGRKM